MGDWIQTASRFAALRITACPADATGGPNRRPTVLTRLTHHLLAAAGALLAGTLLSGCATHLGKPEGLQASTALKRESFTVERDRVYSPADWAQPLRADLYRPSGPGLKPAVLLIHGGGWEAPDRRHQMVSIASRLAERGYVVMNATYRLAPAHRRPAPLEDLQQALTWLRAHSAELSVDPARLATFGYSAGGHLAALLGAIQTAHTPGVRAVVAGGAPTDLRKWPNGRLVVQYMGGRMEHMPEAYHAASPVTQIRPQHPPVFLYHGQSDELVPVDHSTDYKAALDRAGVRNELFLTRGLGHITAFLLDGPAVSAALDFLDRELR